MHTSEQGFLWGLLSGIGITALAMLALVGLEHRRIDLDKTDYLEFVWTRVELEEVAHYNQFWTQDELKKLFMKVKAMSDQMKAPAPVEIEADDDPASWPLNPTQAQRVQLFDETGKPLPFVPNIINR